MLKTVSAKVGKESLYQSTYFEEALAAEYRALLSNQKDLKAGFWH